jgi:flagellar protein FliL
MGFDRLGTDIAFTDTNEEILMAEEEKKAAAPAAGGSMKLIIIINAVVVVALIAVVVMMFMMQGGSDKKDDEVLDDAEQPEESTGKSPGSAPIYIPLSPPFVVNLENQEQVSFLQVEMEVMTYDPLVAEAMKVHASRIRGELLLLLGGKQFHELNNVEGKRKLSQEAIAEIQKILKETGTKGSVQALYFTSFVMQ